MKTSFKAKLIQHLAARKNSEEGFTLIELLVVIIIIGILAAIALPSFLNQAAKARQSEGQTYTGTMNRTQQAFYVENARFAETLNDLKAGVPKETDSYKYSSVGSAAGAPDPKATSVAESKAPELKGFKGLVSIDENQQAAAILCVSVDPGVGKGPAAQASATNVTKNCETGAAL